VSCWQFVITAKMQMNTEAFSGRGASWDQASIDPGQSALRWVVKTVVIFKAGSRWWCEARLTFLVSEIHQFRALIAQKNGLARGAILSVFAGLHPQLREGGGKPRLRPRWCLKMFQDPGRLATAWRSGDQQDWLNRFCQTRARAGLLGRPDSMSLPIATTFGVPRAALRPVGIHREVVPPEVKQGGGVASRETRAPPWLETRWRQLLVEKVLKAARSKGASCR